MVKLNLMGSNIKKILCLLFLLLFFFFNSINTALAAVGIPSIISYQGRLADASGDLLGSSAGTTYYFKFSIWNVATGGTSGTNRLWPTTDPSSFATSVRQGVFNVNIGDTANGFPHTLDYNFNTSSDIYLQIEVSSDDASFQTLSPRQRISAAPFARLSGAVSGTGQSSFGTTTPLGASVVSIEATSTQSIGLTIRAALSQIADLFQIQDSTGANLFVVNSSGYVGVGTTTPNRKLNLLDVNSVPQLRLSQTGAVYGEFYADSAGDVRLSSTGGNLRGNDENLWVCSGGSCGVETPVTKGNIIVETAVIFDNKFKLKQIDASTTIMYDTTDSVILEFDEAGGP